MSSAIGSLPSTTQAKLGSKNTVYASINGNALRLKGSKAALVSTRVNATSKPKSLKIQRVVRATASPIAPGASSTTRVDENAVLDTVIVGGGVSGLTTAMVRI